MKSSLDDSMQSRPSVFGRLLPILVIAGSCGILVIAGFTDWISPSWHLPVGAAAGLVICSALVEMHYRQPLKTVASALRSLECGDLSQTVPEIGSRELQDGARVVNSITADFQEVLLLFAHLVRSGRASAMHLRTYLNGIDEQDRHHAETIIDDIDKMSEMISDFKYFRVRVEDDSIIDTGIGVHHEHSDDRPIGANPDPATRTTPNEGRST